MFGREYKEDALKWRKMQKELAEPTNNYIHFDGGCEVQVHLSNGEILKCYIMSSVGFNQRETLYFDSEMLMIGAKSKLTSAIKSQVNELSIHGVTIGDTHYMPIDIKRFVICEIEVNVR
jgi:hypothetical protein